jgi:hypothetical protein
MTYTFEQFNAEITDPTIEVISVNDNLTAKTCAVDILLVTDNATFGVNLSGFTYTETWEDSDISTWVDTKLQEYAL